MTLPRAGLLVACMLAALPAHARAPAPPPDEEGTAPTTGEEGDDDFGPVVEIEQVKIVGNSRTAEKLIRRAILIKEGDRLRTGNPRLIGSRYRVLALGYFREVKLRLDKGTRRGAIILTVAVEERGTLILNRIFLGNSDITPIWLGLDVGDANFFGSGIAVGAALVWTAEQDLDGGDNQLALQLHIANPSLFGSTLGARGAFVFADASEPFGDGTARTYRRIGGSAGATWQAARLAVLSLDGRVERVHAGATPPPTLEAGDSLLATLTLGFDLDTRRNPILPDGGQHLSMFVEGGGPLGDYEELRFLVRWQGWRKVAAHHVLGLSLSGGLIAGDAPIFDRFYVGNLDPLLPPRALDLVVSDRKSPDIFNDGMDTVTYGRAYAGVSVEYAYQLFRGRRTVYGGDLFASVGLFTLGETDDLHTNLTFNAGLRVDTFIGIFELSLGNALGRIPF